MTIYLKQSTAGQEVPLGYFLDSTDGNTAETGLTIANTDIQIWKTGATTLANKNSGGATHISGGIYYAVLDATDTDTLGSLVIFVKVSGALAVRLECVVLAANVYDSVIGGGDLLAVDAREISSSTSAADNVEANIGNLDATVSTRATAAALTTVDGIVDAILVDTDTTIPGLIAALNDLDSTAVQTAAAAALTAYDPPTNAEMEARTILSANYATATNLATVDSNVDAILVDTDTTIPGLIAALNDLDSTAVQTAAAAALTAYDPPTNAEMEARTLTAASYATAANLATVDSNVDAILVDTGTTIPAQISGLNDLDSTAVQTAAAAALTAYDPPTNAEMEARTILSANYATAANLATVDSVVDAIEVDTQDIQSRLPAALVGGRMNSNAAAINGSASAASQLALSAATIVSGAAVSGTLSTTQMSTDLTEATDGHYNGRSLIWTSGVLVNQATDITGYNGTTKVLTFTGVTEAPTAGDTFVIV